MYDKEVFKIAERVAGENYQTIYDSTCPENIEMARWILDHKDMAERLEKAESESRLYNQWMDGETHCPPFGIPVLGYLQRSMDMEYELDIVHFELTEKWIISTTLEEVDVLFWHVLPEPPATVIR